MKISDPGLQSFLLPYQRDWLLNTEPVAIWVKSRRVGATFVEALRMVLRRLEYKYDGNLVSANAKTSNEFINYCKFWCEFINTAAGHTYINLDNATTETIRFPNGSKIVALSSNPTALRGRSGDVTLDELAFAESPEELVKAAKPVTMWGGTLRMVSSVNGPMSYFQQLVNNCKAGQLPYKLVQTDIFQAVKQGLAMKVPGKHREAEDPNTAFIEQLRAESASEADFDQEFACIPASFSSIISEDAYQKCVIDQLIADHLPDIDCGPLYVGVDIGRRHDLTVIWVLEKGYDGTAEPHLRDVFRTVTIKSVKNMSFEAQFQLISSILENNSLAGCCVDSSGLGMQLAEQLNQQFGSLVKPVHISAPIKQELVERTARFVSQERVSLPADPAIKADIICMRKEVTPKGNVSYGGSSSIGHGDHFIALAMALKSADSSSQLKLVSNPVS